MTSRGVPEIGVHETVRLVRSGERSVEEVVRASLDRIEAGNGADSGL